VDDDCDGTADNSEDNPLWYSDTDGDGYGVELGSVRSCDAPSGHVAQSGDCSPDQSGVHPGATEVCNGLDDNCDAVIDTDAQDQTRWYADTDGDGYGEADSFVDSCDEPQEGEWSSTDDDCAPLDATVNPGAAELADGVDQNCNGDADEPDGGDTDAPSGCSTLPTPHALGWLTLLTMLGGLSRRRKVASE
jgi:hypothetical protein